MVTLAQGWNIGQHQGAAVPSVNCLSGQAECTLYVMEDRKWQNAIGERPLEWTRSSRNLETVGVVPSSK